MFGVGKSDIQALQRRKNAEIRRRIILDKATERMNRLKPAVSHDIASEQKVCEDSLYINNLSLTRCHQGHIHNSTDLFSSNAGDLYSESQPNSIENCCLLPNQLSIFDKSAMLHGTPHTVSTHSTLPDNDEAVSTDTCVSEDYGLLQKRFYVIICIFTAVLLRLVLATPIGQLISNTQSIVLVFVGVETLLIFCRRVKLQRNMSGYLLKMVGLMGIHSNVSGAFTRLAYCILAFLEDFALFFVTYVLTHLCVALF